MARLRRIATTLVLALGLLLGSLAAVGTSGCEVSDDEFYKKDTETFVGRKKNPHRKYALAYVALVLFGAFFMWTVCKSSKRSVVTAGQEH